MADELIHGLIERAMAKKQSSDRVSHLAAKWLKMLVMQEQDLAELRAICASVIAQDEVKGPRKARRRRKSR